MAAGGRCVPLGEGVPVAVGRLVGADLRGHDRPVEGDADGGQRGVDEVAVGVRQGDEPPAAPVGLAQRGGHVCEHRPAGQRASQRVTLVFRQRHVDLDGQLRQRRGHHLAVAGLRALGLDPRLDLVVAGEQPVGLLFPEQTGELTPDPGVPVDQCPVAIEGRPAHTPRVPAHSPTITPTDSYAQRDVVKTAEWTRSTRQPRTPT